MGPRQSQNAVAKTPTTHEPALGFRVWRIKSPLSMHQAHSHPDIEMNWLPAGSLQYVMAGKRASITAGQLGIFWGGVPHQLIESQNVDGGIWLTLPLAWFLRCGFSNDFAARLMTGKLFTIAVAQERTNQWLEDFQAGANRRRLVLLELEALIERLALQDDPSTRAPRKARAQTGDG